MAQLKPSKGPANAYQGPRGPLQHRCAQCDATGGVSLAICTGCRAVRYCSKTHQIDDRPKHKAVCNKIKKQRAKLLKEESLVRNAPNADGLFTPVNAFETHVGHFWGITNTRTYMRARFFLADQLRKTNTLDGVQEGLGHLQDMLRLCRSDNLGVRSLVPALMLQLDQDQECYDFIKWYQTEGTRVDYDWGNMELPYLNITDADPLESIAFMQRKYSDAYHTSTLVLLKIKMLVDVMNIRATRMALQGKLPRELWQGVELASIRSPLSAPLTKLSSSAIVGVQAKLARHVRILGIVLLEDVNRHIPEGLLAPDEWLRDLPTSYSSGSAQEMQLVLDYSYGAWWATEGALESLHAAKADAALAAEDEMDGMMQSESLRTRAELLDDVSLTRIWGHFFMGTWQEANKSGLDLDNPSPVLKRYLRAYMDENDEADYYGSGS